MMRNKLMRAAAAARFGGKRKMPRRRGIIDRRGPGVLS